MHILPSLTNLAKLQFYKEKAAPVRNFDFSHWLLGHFGQFYNSTRKCTYPLLKQIWPQWLNYSSTRKRQLLSEIFDFGHWPLGHFGQFYNSTRKWSSGQW